MSAGGSCASRLDARVGLDLAAELVEQRGHRVADARATRRSATGHPWRCPAVRIADPDRAVTGRCSGWKACAATPPNSARACSVRNARASVEAGSSVGAPKRASAPGAAGCAASGRMMSSARSSKSRDGAAEQRRQRRRRAPRPAAVSLDRAVQHPGRAAVERVDAVDLRPRPPQPVAVQAELGAGTASRPPWVEGRAVVVAAARARSPRRCARRRRFRRPPRGPSPRRPAGRG